MDSLFIARTSDMATGVEVILPFVSMAEELKWRVRGSGMVTSLVLEGGKRTLTEPLSVTFRIKFPLTHQL